MAEIGRWGNLPSHLPAPPSKTLTVSVHILEEGWVSAARTWKLWNHTGVQDNQRKGRPDLLKALLFPDGPRLTSGVGRVGVYATLCRHLPLFTPADNGRLMQRQEGWGHSWGSRVCKSDEASRFVISQYLRVVSRSLSCKWYRRFTKEPSAPRRQAVFCCWMWFWYNSRIRTRA